MIHINKNNYFRKLFSQYKKGISMISLIITIIVIIILATIVLFSGLNTPDKASFAKYTQQVDNFQTAVQEEYSRKTTYYATNHLVRNDAQTYYTIATGSEIDVNTKTEDLKAGTLEELGLQTKPDNLQGSEYYEVVVGTSIAGKKDEKGLYQTLGTAEKHYITDRGEFFVLPGYPEYENGTTRWFVTAGKYYEGDTPITNNFVNEAKVIFNANGGSVSEVIRRVNEGEKLGTLPVPYRYGYLFEGWYSALEGGNEITENTRMGSETITCFAHWKQAAADVNGTFYMTLKEAINIVPKDGTLTTVSLLKDVTENIQISSNQSIILQMQSHQITNANTDAVISNDGTLEVIGGTIVTTSPYNSAINNNSSAVLKVTDQSIRANGSKQALYNNKGTATIAGNCFISCTASGKPTVDNLAGSTMTITGGTIISSQQNAVNNAGNLTIGIKDGTMNKNTPSIQGASYGVNSSQNYSLYDGILKGKTNATNNEAKITALETGYSIKTGEETIQGSSYKTLYLANGMELGVEVSGSYYRTISESLANIPDNTPVTINLIDDINDTLTITKNKDITLNLQGHTFRNTATTSAITNYGRLEIFGGTMNGINALTIKNKSGGNLSVHDATFITTAGNGSALFNDGGTFEITNCTVSSTTKPAITNSGGTMTIKGGSIVSQNDIGISNNATLTIGEKDGNLLTSPLIKAYKNGIYSTKDFSFYDGIVKSASTNAINNESKIKNKEDNATLTHETENIDGTQYNVVYFINN